MEHPTGNRKLGGVENQGQNLDTHLEEGRLPPTPILQPRRGGKHQWLQNQRVVAKGRHQSHETESNFRMLGEIPLINILLF